VWTIRYTDQALRDLRGIDSVVGRRILDFMDKRVARLRDPRQIGERLHGKLGTYWRFRIGDYRAICEVKDELVTVIVIAIGHRREIYR
jgi:mRNA interferase RelE/StbE